MVLNANQRLAGILVSVTIGMFVFAVFVLPPMYEVFCEITGLNGRSENLSTKAELTDYEKLRAKSGLNIVTFDASSELNETNNAQTNSEEGLSITNSAEGSQPAEGSQSAEGSSIAEGSPNEQPVGHTLTVQFLADTDANMPWEFKPERFSVKAIPGQPQRINYYAKNNANLAITGQAVPSVTPGHMGKYLKKIECFCFTQQTLDAKEETLMPLRFTITEDAPKDIGTITLSYKLYNIEQRKKDQDSDQVSSI